MLSALRTFVRVSLQASGISNEVDPDVRLSFRHRAGSDFVCRLGCLNHAEVDSILKNLAINRESCAPIKCTTLHVVKNQTFLHIQLERNAVFSSVLIEVYRDQIHYGTISPCETSSRYSVDCIPHAFADITSTSLLRINLVRQHVASLLEKRGYIVAKCPTTLCTEIAQYQLADIVLKDTDTTACIIEQVDLSPVINIISAPSRALLQTDFRTSAEDEMFELLRIRTYTRLRNSCAFVIILSPDDDASSLSLDLQGMFDSLKPSCREFYFNHFSSGTAAGLLHPVVCARYNCRFLEAITRHLWFEKYGYKLINVLASDHVIFYYQIQIILQIVYYSYDGTVYHQPAVLMIEPVKYTSGVAEVNVELHVDELSKIIQTQIKTDTNEHDSRELTTAALSFLLLGTEIGHLIKIDIKKNILRESGAPFVLYNIARISAIIKKFTEGPWLSLPAIFDTDFSLLREQEEWDLLLRVILMYPEVVCNASKSATSFTSSSTHKVVSFLNMAASLFRYHF